MNLTEEIKNFLKGLGAEDVRIADPRLLREYEVSNPDQFLPDTKAVICFYTKTSKEAVKEITKGDPKKGNAILYWSMRNLFEMTKKACKFLENKGYKSYEMEPCSTFLDKRMDRMPKLPKSSHLIAGIASGLGTLGWNGLLLTENGSYNDITSFPTTALLEFDEPLKENYCSRCLKCVNTCPAGFISREQHEVSLGKYKFIKGKHLHPNVCRVFCSGFVSEMNGIKIPNSKFGVPLTEVPPRAGHWIAKKAKEMLAKGGEYKDFIMSKINYRNNFFKSDKPVLDLSCSLCRFVCKGKTLSKEEYLGLLMEMADKEGEIFPIEFAVTF